jgi:hypothetical protein
MMPALYFPGFPGFSAPMLVIDRFWDTEYVPPSRSVTAWCSGGESSGEAARRKWFTKRHEVRVFNRFNC